MTAEERRRTRHGILSFDVHPGELDVSKTVTVSFDASLFWVELEADRSGRLARVSLLATADFVGRGELSGELRFVGEGAQGERWTIEIDPSSVDGPPIAPQNVHAADFEPVPDAGTSSDGTASIRTLRADDSTLRSIDITLRSCQ